MSESNMKHVLLLVALIFAGQVTAQQSSCCDMGKTKKKRRKAKKTACCDMGDATLGCKGKSDARATSLEANNSTDSDAPVQFASFGSDEEFRSKHPDPKPLKNLALKGKMIKFDVKGGEQGNAYFVEAQGSNNVLLVFHEWWGLNDHIKSEADRLYKELGKKTHVMAIDLYDGKVATVRDSAAKYMKAVDKERAMNIINGATTLLPPEPSIATIGWCFGGGWSMQTAIELREKAVACVVYYGMLEMDDNRVEELQADVLGIFASKDKWIDDRVIDGFVRAIKMTEVKFEYKVFEADHAFANPSREIYNEEAAKEANAMTLKFLKARLPEGSGGK